MIIPIKEIIKKAERGKYAVGAFNTANLETTLGIIRAVKKTRRAAIIQVSQSTIKYAGLKTIMKIIEFVDKSEANKTPLAIHLDHGKDFKVFQACVQAGFSSVHWDGSELPYGKNVKTTRRAALYGHRFGAWVQGELGYLFGQEGQTKIKLPKDRGQYMTDPEKVADFVVRTGVDTLAVSVGTLHGLYHGREKIDFPRLAAIHQAKKIPLVLHGGSGVPDSDLRRAVKNGVRIVNLDTVLRLAFTQTLRQTIKETKDFYDPRKILAPSIEAVTEVVAQKIIVLGG